MKKEFLEGYRSFLFFLISCVFFGLFVWRGEGIQAFPWFFACGTVFLGKNYLQSKIEKPKIEITGLKVTSDDGVSGQ